MTGSQYRSIRKKLGLSQAGLARRLNITSNHVARRERGEQRVTREAELAIRALAQSA